MSSNEALQHHLGDILGGDFSLEAIDREALAPTQERRSSLDESLIERMGQIWELGRLFSSENPEEIQAATGAPDGLFFRGDAWESVHHLSLGTTREDINFSAMPHPLKYLFSYALRKARGEAEVFDLTFSAYSSHGKKSEYGQRTISMRLEPGNVNVNLYLTRTDTIPPQSPQINLYINSNDNDVERYKDEIILPKLLPHPELDNNLGTPHERMDNDEAKKVLLDYMLFILKEEINRQMQ